MTEKMKSLDLILNEVELQWRREVHRDFPRRGNTPVVRSSKKTGRDWTFWTDLTKIFVDISDDESLQAKFENILPEFWEGTPDSLASDTLHYLLFHELYHPEEAPFSISGPDNDKKRIHQAMRRGLLKAEPNLSPSELLSKIHASQNAIKDFILDNRLYLDNLEKKYFQDDIIPTWDVLELQDSPARTNLYSITRFLYGVLYGPESTHDFFTEKMDAKGVMVAEKAMSALISSPVKFTSEPKGLFEKLKSALIGDGTEKISPETLKEYASKVRVVFSGEDRYKGIERFMEVLGPYVEQGMPQGKPSLGGDEESGGSPQNILQDLLDDMTPEEQSQFTEQLGGDKNLPKELESLDLFALHEFYKLNHPKVTLVGGNKVGESVVVGKKKYWKLQRSTTLAQDQLGRLNLARIELLHRRSNRPWLIPLENGLFRLDEYELKEREIKDIVYVEKSLDVPDVVEFYVDSSGSMYDQGGGKVSGFNDGSRWDLLSNVLYGYVDALVKGGKLVGKTTKIRINNVGDSQVSSKEITAEEFMKGDKKTLETLFKPNNGGSRENLDITQYNDGKKRAYVVVTDGQLVIGGRTERESRKMKELARNPNNSVVLFEIGGTYGLGNTVKNDSNITYVTVYNKKRMLQAGLEVLLSK